MVSLLKFILVSDLTISKTSRIFLRISQYKTDQNKSAKNNKIKLIAHVKNKNHCFTFENARIVAIEEHDRKRKIREVL